MFTCVLVCLFNEIVYNYFRTSVNDNDKTIYRHNLQAFFQG
jgi:hypothetical protein